VVASAVKLADDGSGDVVVRVYESRGGRATASLTPGFHFLDVEVCDLLERPLDDQAEVSTIVEDGAVSLRLRPFQLVTLRFTRSTSEAAA
jgi:alpha-mannosidase